MAQGNGVSTGYVKLHRTLLDHPIFTQLSLTVLKVWIACLLRANWKPTRWYDGHQQVEIPAGAFIFSQETLAKLCGLSRRQVQIALKHLQNLQCVSIHMCSRYSLLVIQNWATYQSDETTGVQEMVQEVCRTRAGGAQEPCTDKEVKKLRREEQHPASDDARLGPPAEEGPSLRTGPKLFPLETVNGKNYSTGAAKNGNSRASELASQQAAWFAEWWRIYWLKKAKKDAWKAFQKHVKTEERFQVVMAATRAQTPEMLQREPSKRPYAATWLNGERWEDESTSPPIGPQLLPTPFQSTVDPETAQRIRESQHAR